MSLVVLGLNHKTAPVAVRECLAFSEEQIKQSLLHLREFEEIEECVILSTCNRTEMYAVVEEPEDAFSLLVDFWRQRGAGQLDVDQNLFYHIDEDCIRHLFRVAASLDSLVIGEGQILSQVKKAYSLARDIGTTSTVLNTLFNRAIASGKRVRTDTRIAYTAVSVSYAAVELAKKLLGDLAKAKVLLLGAGQMSELTARHLVDNGVNTVFVSNRNLDRARQLADRFRGFAVPFEHFMESAEQADIVITSTGAPHYLIRSWDVAHLMPKRQGRPIIFIDIAVPRDVEPEVAALAGVNLYNIDDLEAVAESNMRGREKEAKDAERIIEADLADLIAKFRYLSFRPTLARLRDKVEAVRQREMKRALAKLPEATPEERKVLENLSKMLVRKLIRDPIIRINEAAGTDKEAYFLDAARKLFKLDDIGEEAPSEKNKSCHRYARQ